MQVNIAPKLINGLEDILEDYSYSTSSSLKLYKDFISRQGMKSKTVEGYIHQAEMIHQKFPFLAGLAEEVKCHGLIDAAKAISPCQYAYVSGYLYFLAIIRLLRVEFTDYFLVNPKTINRLGKWYAPYLDILGISDVCTATESVCNRTRNRVVNKEKTWIKVHKTSIYLILRYQLKSMYELTDDEWLEFRTEITEKNSGRPTNIVEANLMQQALFDLGIISENYLHRTTWEERKYSFDRMEEIKPIVDKYKTYISARYKRSTQQHKLRALELFFSYVLDHFQNSEPQQYDLSMLKRSFIVDYISAIRKLQISKSEKEGRIYGLRCFFDYIEGNRYELTSTGLILYTDNVYIRGDFKLPSLRRNNLPRPLSDRVFNALKNTLPHVSSVLFIYAFLLMAATGLPMEVITTLTRDCVRQRMNGKYYLSYFRPKIKREIITKISEETYKIISLVKELNTQVQPLPHACGSEKYYLFNDGGNRLMTSWFTQQFNRLKTEAARRSPELADEIMKASPHRIRHTFATKLRENGADIYAIAYALGHKSINTTKIYTKDSDTLKQQYINQLNDSYACEADPNLLSARSAVGENALQEILHDYNNHVGYGICIVQATHNCPNENKCLDCGYLCSTKEDIPDIVFMIDIMKDHYEELIAENDSCHDPAIMIEIEKTEKRIKRLCEKVSILTEPATLNAIDEAVDELNIEEVICFD